MTAIIPNYETLSQKEKNKKVLEFVNEEFSIRKLNPVRVYAMADKLRNNSVSLRDVLVAMQKMIPDIP